MASHARMSSGPASRGAFTTTSTASMSGLRAPFSMALRNLRVFGDGAWATISNRFMSRLLYRALQQFAVSFGRGLGRFFLDRLGHQLVTHLGLDFIGDIQVLFQELTGVCFALADLVTVIGVPGARLVHKAFFHAHVEHFRHVVDA